MKLEELKQRLKLVGHTSSRWDETAQGMAAIHISKQHLPAFVQLLEVAKLLIHESFQDGGWYSYAQSERDKLVKAIEKVERQ